MKGSCDFKDMSLLGQDTTLLSLVAIGTVVVEILWF